MVTRVTKVPTTCGSVPTLRLEFVRCAGTVYQEYPSAAGDLADLRNWNAANTRWDPLVAGSGEQEFVVFSAMQGKLQIDFPRRLAHAGSRDGFGLQFGADATFLADVGKVGGKAIAGVYHRRGQVFLAQNSAQLDSWLGEKMPRVVPWIELAPGILLHLPEGCRRAAEFSAHIDAIPWPCPET